MQFFVEAMPVGMLPFVAGYGALLIVPGPSMLAVSSAGMRGARRCAGAAAFGVAIGTALLILGVFQARAQLASVPALSIAGELMFAATLLIVGANTIRRAVLPINGIAAARARGTGTACFVLGLLAALTNPISLAFFTSVVLSVPAEALAQSRVMLPIGVFVMALGWFSLVGLAVSSAMARSISSRITKPVQAGAGVFMVAIAIATLQGAGG
ncbi:LysE family transporter [Mesorhizobium sp. CAU 1732]|uniref:LysE family transporter n=1 Tax=Mesorhizobium sp. CAU 1732 TaxID=3140358 RepID=UPI003260542C